MVHISFSVTGDVVAAAAVAFLRSVISWIDKGTRNGISITCCTVHTSTVQYEYYPYAVQIYRGRDKTFLPNLTKFTFFGMLNLYLTFLQAH